MKVTHIVSPQRCTAMTIHLHKAWYSPGHGGLAIPMGEASDLPWDALPNSEAWWPTNCPLEGLLMSLTMCGTARTRRLHPCPPEGCGTLSKASSSSHAPREQACHPACCSPRPAHLDTLATWPSSHTCCPRAVNAAGQGWEFAITQSHNQLWSAVCLTGCGPRRASWGGPGDERRTG